jgi:hypothetical protein
VIAVDNGPEFAGKALNEWAFRKGIKLSFIRLGKPIDLCYLTKSDTILKFATAYKEDIFMDNGTVQIYKMLFSKKLFEKIHLQNTTEKLATGDLGLAIMTAAPCYRQYYSCMDEISLALRSGRCPAA